LLGFILLVALPEVHS